MNNSEIKKILNELSILPKINKFSSKSDIKSKLINFTNFINSFKKYYPSSIFELVQFIFKNLLFIRL